MSTLREHTASIWPRQRHTNGPAARSKTRLAVYAAAAALTSGTVLAVTAPGGEATQAAPSDCYTDAGVSGYATNTDGTPLVGAPVIVHGEPSREVKPGTRYSDPLLGWTRTDEDGCYQVDIAASKALTRSADRYGVVNVRVTLQRSDRLEMVTFAKALTTRGTQAELVEVNDAKTQRSWRPARVAAGSNVAGAIHQSFGPQATSARTGTNQRQAAGRSVTLGGYTGTMSPPTAATDAGLEPDVAMLPRPVDRPLLRSDEKLDKVFRKHSVLVGQWWSKTPGVKQKWIYAQGGSTQMQSALKIYSGGGDYEKSKVYAKSLNRTVGFPKTKGRVGAYFRSFFRNARYTLWYCDPSVGCMTTGSRVKVYSWEGGTDPVYRIPYPKVTHAYCTPYAAGSDDSSKGSTALTWTNGVTIGGDLLKELGGEIKLSAQTGFTASAENQVTFHRAGQLCGVFGRLSETPGALIAIRP